MYSCYMDYSYMNIHVLLLHENFLTTVYACFLYHNYMIVSCIPDIDMTLLLPGYISNWPKMCGTKCHTGQSATPHTWRGPPLEPRRGPPLKAHVLWISCLMLSRYMLHACTCLVIPLHVTYTIIVTDSLYNLFMIKVTWGWGKLDGWLGVIG